MKRKETLKSYGRITTVMLIMVVSEFSLTLKQTSSDLHYIKK